MFDDASSKPLSSVPLPSPETEQVDALQHEQEMLKVLLDNVQTGIVACNAQGILTLFNQVAREFHGLPEQPLPPEQWAEYYDLYRADGKTRMSQHEIPLFRALQGETVHNVEMVIAPKGKMARTLLASGQAIIDAQGNKQGAVVVMHDITERKQMENVLRESEARLFSIFQTIPDGVIILDQHGQIAAANSAAEQILGLASGVLAQRVYNDPNWSITTLDGQPFPEEELPFTRVMQTRKPVYAVEHAISHADGTRKLLSINASPLFDTEGHLINVVASVSDITARKQAEVTLQESEERYRSVIETAAEGIVLQYADGTIFTCNVSAEQILGLTAAQMMGRTSLDPRWSAIHEDGSPFPGEQHPAMITLQTGEPQSNQVMGVCKPDGTLTWISINTRPLFQAHDPKPFAVVASFFDITDRKQAETERDQLIREQAARLEAEADQRRSAFLVEVSTALASSLDYEQTLQSVAQLAVPYFADWCSVDLLNDDGSISRVAVAHSDPEKVQFGWELAQRFSRHLDDGYGVSEVMKTGRSEIAIAITDEQLATIPNPEYLEILRGIGLKSCIVSPLQARGRVMGGISFAFAESNRHYSPADLTLAEDLARRAAIAIDNARLYYTAQQAKQAAETAADRTARLQAVTAALAESLTPEQVANVVVEQSVAALGAKAALVALVSPDRTELEIVQSIDCRPELIESWHKFPIDADAPLAKAVRTGQPQWLETLADRVARYPHLATAYSHYNFESWMSLPLIVEGVSIGGIALGFASYRHLSQADREFILALSRQCAQAISRAQLYEAERQARAEAEQANQVKDEFLAVLSHELRSPLNPILGWSRLLQTKHDNLDTLLRGLQTIERNAKLQTQLIEDLLDVSRILRGKLSLTVAPVDLKSTIDAAIETVRLAAEAKKIDLQFTVVDFDSNDHALDALDFKISNPHYHVSGDAARLQQVVWNLLSNAVKFTPDGGRVEVKLEQAFSPTQRAIALSSHYAYAQITVTDTGQGIKTEFLPYIFERFRQADSKTTRKFGGLGLGLAIVRQLVELHGGTVQVDSPGEGQGATFTVRLPLLSKQIARPIEEPYPLTPLSSYPLLGVRILVVDDAPDTRELLMFVLEEAGASVSSVSSAIEALQWLATSNGKIDVLISDIGMPEMDGYMLMRHLKAQFAEQDNSTPPFHAIALTAYAEEANQKQALAAGFQRYLSKPVDPNELIDEIASLVN
ncbi:MAG: PAS domain S-box protein [Thainema sp.]